MLDKNPSTKSLSLNDTSPYQIRDTSTPMASTVQGAAQDLIGLDLSSHTTVTCNQISVTVPNINSAPHGSYTSDARNTADIRLPSTLKIHHERPQNTRTLPSSKISDTYHEAMALQHDPYSPTTTYCPYTYQTATNLAKSALNTPFVPDSSYDDEDHTFGGDLTSWYSEFYPKKGMATAKVKIQNLSKSSYPHSQSKTANTALNSDVKTPCVNGLSNRSWHEESDEPPSSTIKSLQDKCTSVQVLCVPQPKPQILHLKAPDKSNRATWLHTLKYLEMLNHEYGNVNSCINDSNGAL